MIRTYNLIAFVLSTVDTNIALQQIDFLESPALKNVVILSTGLSPCLDLHLQNAFACLLLALLRMCVKLVRENSVRANVKKLLVVEVIQSCLRVSMSKKKGDTPRSSCVILAQGPS